MNPEAKLTLHPCSACRWNIAGPHYRLYPRPQGSGCHLLCLGCAPTYPRSHDELWFEAPYPGVGKTLDSVQKWVRKQAESSVTGRERASRAAVPQGDERRAPVRNGDIQARDDMARNGDAA